MTPAGSVVGAREIARSVCYGAGSTVTGSSVAGASGGDLLAGAGTFGAVAVARRRLNGPQRWTGGYRNLDRLMITIAQVDDESIPDRR